MSTKNRFYIKKEKNFKLYIPLKEQIIFESEMNKNGIDFYSNLNEQPIINEGIRYFLLETDKIRIDEIIKENGILSGIESTGIVDYTDSKKMYKIYLKMVLTIFLFFSIIGLTLYIYDKLILKLKKPAYNNV